MAAELQSSTRDTTGYLNLNRPQFHNAITKEMWLEIPHALSKLRDDGACSVVMTGSGDSFSSGANLDELEQLQTFDAAASLWHAIRDALSFVADFELPVIAAVQGACIGGGCLLACACDMRFASTKALFGIPTSKLGLTLDDYTVSRLVSQVGPSVAKFLLMTGKVISAEEAKKFGLVDFVLSSTELDEHVVEVAASIAQNEQSAVRRAKRAVNRVRKGLELTPAENDADVVGAYLSSNFRERLRKLREY